MTLDLTIAPGSTIINKTGDWRTYIPKTDLDVCIGCSRCALVCPENCVKMKANAEGKNKPQTDYDFCKGCGLCAAECPVKCIKMEIEKK
ncbi:MAG: 4Fe-4S dicluster-binding protein [Patescibacteria group bacterium]|jgi:2-oxoacid:acceptor oxidoreductase delta subunit (pyruvate/2-ketoisovalerate family)